MYLRDPYQSVTVELVYNSGMSVCDTICDSKHIGDPLRISEHNSYMESY